MKTFNRVAEQPDPVVAPVAEGASNCAGGVAVVDNAGLPLAAYSTQSALTLDEILVLVRGQAVPSEAVSVRVRPVTLRPAAVGADSRTRFAARLQRGVTSTPAVLVVDHIEG